jgi:hypothetical protein
MHVLLSFAEATLSEDRVSPRHRLIDHHQLCTNVTSCLRSNIDSGHLTHLRRRLGAGGLAATPLAVFPEAGSTPGFLHRELRSLLNIAWVSK